MKRILGSLVAVSMIATPVAAHERGYESYEHEEHEHHGASAGAIIGALLLGGIIAGASERRDRRYENPYDHTPRLQSGYTDQYGYWHDCYDEQVTERDYYGRLYQHWVRRCY